MHFSICKMHKVSQLFYLAACRLFHVSVGNTKRRKLSYLYHKAQDQAYMNFSICRIHIKPSLNIRFLFTSILRIMLIRVYNSLLKFIKKYIHITYIVGIILVTFSEACSITVSCSNIKGTSDQMLPYSSSRRTKHRKSEVIPLCNSVNCCL